MRTDRRRPRWFLAQALPQPQARLSDRTGADHFAATSMPGEPARAVIPPVTPPAQSRIAARILAVLCAAFMASQFYRVSNAVIAPELMRTLSISSEVMGVITGAYFFAFGLMQIPTGMLLDRFGPRRTMSGLFVVAAAGSAVFATADGGLGLTVGRALIGVGCAAGLMGILVSISRWYPPERFAGLSGLVYVFGGAGVLFATTPLAAAADTIGWRGAFWVMTVITLGLAALMFATVRDAPPGQAIESADESFGEMIAGVRAVAANRQLWHVCAIQFVNYGTILAIVGLWAGPYLNDVHGMQGVLRGNVLFVINLAMLAGVLVYGIVERRLGSRKRAIVWGSVASAAILLVLAFGPDMGPWPAVGLLITFTFTSAHIMLNHAHARAVLPDHLVGRGLTLQNVAVFFGVATMQSATGLIVGRFTEIGEAAPDVAYRSVFGFLALMIVLSLVLYLPVRDVRTG